MDNPKKYLDFSVEDFVSDEYFQDWILQPSEQKDNFWHHWLLENPDRHLVVREARILLESLRFTIDRPAEGRARQALAHTRELIGLLERNERRMPPLWHRLRPIWRMAAIAILITGAVLFVYLFNLNPKISTVATAFGEMDSIRLPDKSLVVLNANSSIRYEQDWNKKAPREVWLTGEALFKVSHINIDKIIQPAERFVVHVGQASIEVLGTSFNVRQRREKIEIALLTGSIRLKFENNDRPAVFMKPGELLMFDTSLNKIFRTTTNPGYTSWTENRLVLNTPTLGEITNYLEDIYGKEIVLSDPRLALKEVEGPILLDSLEDALFIISTVLNVSITEENNRLILKPR
jgi:transmembrane sensor